MKKFIRGHFLFRSVFLWNAALCLLTLRVLGIEPSGHADVLVYGATAGGVAASVAAARHGAKVILVEPGRHVGGMLSGGLGHTDFLRQEKLIGGLAHEVFERIGKHYGKPVVFDFEPHVAEQVLNDMLREADVHVIFGQRVDSAVRDGSRIVTLKTQTGATHGAKVFIDASYEGDLMKAAGVSYTVGRESRAKFGEWLAGRQDLLPGHNQFKFAVSPWLEGKLLPFITPEEKLAGTGESDGKFQAYCFRLCLTDRATNQIPITQPTRYDPADYELLRRYFQAAGDKLTISVLGIARLPGGKCDVNSNGAISTDLLGANWEYPEATPERRREIWDLHMRWAHGLMWFLQNDPAVPAQHRDEARRWALCKDEFQDNGGWPHQLYIREGRRMLGEYVLTQHDLETQRRKYDVVGMAGYNMDVREVQWVSKRVFYFPKAADEVFTEGYISQPVLPYDLPYRAMLPRFGECQNLLVPVCISASTIAYSSFRMEPGYMIAGHASGVAAAFASRDNSAVHHVPLAELQRTLREEGQIMEAKTP